MCRAWIIHYPLRYVRNPTDLAQGISHEPRDCICVSHLINSLPNVMLRPPPGTCLKTRRAGFIFLGGPHMNPKSELDSAQGLATTINTIPALYQQGILIT